jgi:hypothetical protein
MVDETFHDVVLGNPDDSDFNTIVLSGIDVVVPLEFDVDGDPLHDDEVRLQSEDGSYESVLLASHEDVKADADKRLVLYRFRAVPPGLYRVSVRIGAETWADIVVDLLVSSTGVSLGGKSLTSDDPPAITADDDAGGDDADADDGGDDEDDDYVEANDATYDVDDDDEEDA